MNWYKKSISKEPWEMTQEEFSTFNYGLLPDSDKNPIVKEIKKLLESNGITVEEIGIKGSHRFGLSTTKSDLDIYIKVPQKDFNKADTLVEPFSRTGIDVLLNWTGVGLKGGPIRGEKTHRRLIERALKERKPVPPKVLKDYPDLEQKK